MLNWLLFLCSRDIQVGDKVKVPQTKDNFKNNDFNYEGIVQEVHQFEVQVRVGQFDIPFPKSYCLKVIGEISPEAIWVKEGDEFDYQDVRIFYSCEKGDECDIYYGAQLCSAPHNILNPIEFKCPTCKKFH